tara:strand:- start:959 stop:1084 length:126 start_codon:yes stop_codon:yes gene_type:complete
MKEGKMNKSQDLELSGAGKSRGKQQSIEEDDEEYDHEDDDE